MKKAWKWIRRILITLLVTIAVLPLIFFGIIFIGLKGMEAEWDSLNDDAESALCKTGLADYAEYATWYDLSISGALTAFVMPKYDNHTDMTNLHAGIMAHAAHSAAGWQTDSVTANEYAALQEAHLPQAAFLQPAADIVFDAQYVDMTGGSPTVSAFFDQDTGLMICLCTDVHPKAGNVRANGLTVPHDGWVYARETHSGLLGDGDTYYALIVPEDDRAAFEATLAAHADWHEGAVTRAEYIAMQKRVFYEVPDMFPAEDVVFDRWCYVDTFARAHPDWPAEDAAPDKRFPAAMQEAAARPTGNWLVALYDAQTGLFIYYAYDS